MSAVEEGGHGLLECAACGALLCVLQRDGHSNMPTHKTHFALQPEPAPDVSRVLCAGCGATLWEAGDE